MKDKSYFVHQNRHEFTKCISFFLVFFGLLGVFLFFVEFFFYFISECRDIASILFSVVVSSGLKSLDIVCLHLILFCEI